MNDVEGEKGISDGFRRWLWNAAVFISHHWGKRQIAEWLEHPAADPATFSDNRLTSLRLPDESPADDTMLRPPTWP